MTKRRLSIRTKVWLGNLIILFCLGVAIVVLTARIASLQKEIDFVSGHDLTVHETIAQLEKDLLDMETGMRGFVLTGDEAYLEPYASASSRWETDYDQLKELTRDNAAQQTRLDTVRASVETWMKEAGDKAIQWKREGSDSELDSFFANDTGKQQMDLFRSRIDTFRSAEKTLTADRVANLKDSNRTLIIVLYLLWLGVAVVSIATGSVVGGNLVRSIRRISTTIRGMARDGYERGERIELGTRDEMEELAEATNELIAKMEKDGLRKERIAEVATLLQGERDLEAVGRQFLGQVVQMFSAPYAVIYQRDLSNQLVRLAAFAVSGEELGRSSFGPGEGLVGQCAEDNRMLVISNLPDAYAVVRSGIGEASPRQLVVAPIAFENQVVGVLELGVFREIDEDGLDSIKQLASMLGVTIHSVAKQNEIQQLYVEAQAANEELQVQSEELNAQSLELLGMNDELKQVSAYKSEFLANMSHELRTPLNSMLILSQMLAENRDGRLSEEEVSFVSTIYAAGNDLMNLINDILDLSKVEAGKLEVSLTSVVLDDLLQSVQDEFRGAAVQKRLEFEVRAEPGVPECFESDGFRVQQILRNLLSNAFKFTERGSVTLRVEKRRADAWGAEELAFIVRDSGRGIPEEKHEFIFESFTQADGGTARKYGGTGLGLKISRQLANLLGGSIVLDSRPGEGSEFTLLLPAQYDVSPLQGIAAALEEPADGIEARGAPARGETALLQGKKVLVVDDDARNLFALTNLLESFKMDVAIAHDGLECLGKLEKESFDIILMDVMMPDLDGLETIRTIREKRGLKLPIIAVTAKAMKEDREKCLLWGANAYMSKPIATGELIELILNHTIGLAAGND